MTDIVPVATVEVKSAWYAKINWTQAIGMVATGVALASGNKYQVPADVQVALVAAIQGAVAVTTWVLRTWFNGTVAPGSISK